jgi:hypothetical protein
VVVVDSRADLATVTFPRPKHHGPADLFFFTTTTISIPPSALHHEPPHRRDSIPSTPNSRRSNAVHGKLAIKAELYCGVSISVSLGNFNFIGYCSYLDSPHAATGAILTAYFSNMFHSPPVRRNIYLMRSIPDEKHCIHRYCVIVD